MLKRLFCKHHWKVIYKHGKGYDHGYTYSDGRRSDYYKDPCDFEVCLTCGTTRIDWWGRKYKWKGRFANILLTLCVLLLLSVIGGLVYEIIT
jgi:hypothetical protein